MLSIGKIKAGSAQAHADYYLNQAERREDYYAKSGEPTGVWRGNGLEALGLKPGQNVGEELKDLFEGFHPETGEKLGQNAGHERRLSAFDLTFSAGKDLSIIAGVASDDVRAAIIDAHEQAVQRAMAHIEANLAETRRGKEGVESEKAGGLAWADFQHLTTRGGERGVDMLLHSHNLVINAVKRPDGTWGSLDGKKLYDAKMACGAMYRAELVKNVRERLGIELEVYTHEKGYIDFRVKGIDDDVRKAFSQRRDQIVEKLKEWEDSLNNPDAAADVAAVQTRAAKQEVDREVLIAEWRDRALALGLSAEDADRLAGRTAEQAEQRWIDDLARRGLTDREAEEAIGNRVWAGVDDSEDFEGVAEGLGMVEDELFARYTEAKERLAAGDSAQQQPALHIHEDTARDRERATKTYEDERFASVYAKLTEMDVLFHESDVLRAVAEDAITRGEGIDYIEQAEHDVWLKGEIVELGQNEKGQTVYTTRTMQAIEKNIQRIVAENIDSKSHHLSRDLLDQHIAAFEQKNGFSLSEQQKDILYNITTEAGLVSSANGKAGAGKSTSMQVLNAAYTDQGFAVYGAAPSGKAAAELEEGSGIKSQTLDRLLIDLESGKKPFADKSIIVLDEAGMVASAKMERLMRQVEAAYKAGKTVHLQLLGDTRQLQAVEAGPAAKIAQETMEANGQRVVWLDEIRRQKLEWARDASQDFSNGKAAEALAEYYVRDKVYFYQSDKDGAKADDHRFEAIQGMVKSWMQDLNNGVAVERTLMLASTRAEVYQSNYVAHALMREAGRLGEVGYTVETKYGEREFRLNERVVYTENQHGVKNGWTGTVTDIQQRDGELYLTVDCDNGQQHTHSVSELKGKIDWAYTLTTHKSQGLTKTNVHVLAGGAMTDLQTLYVNMTRHKDEAIIHIDKSAVLDTLYDAREEGELEVGPTDKMIRYAENLAEQHEVELPAGYQEDFFACRDFLNKYAKHKIDGHGTATESSEAEAYDDETEIMAKLAELGSRNRQKESTLDWENGEQKAKQTNLLDPSDPRSKLTQAERFKIAVQTRYDKQYDNPNIEQLPKFDRLEQQAIRRLAGKLSHDSIATDKPLEQTEAYKLAAREWMSMRSHERKDFVRQEAAREFIATKQAKQRAALTR